MSQEIENQSSSSVLKKIWYGLFILIYPIIITFSLVFTGILLLFSTLSKLIFKIISLFSKNSEPNKIVKKVEPIVNQSSANI